MRISFFFFVFFSFLFADIKIYSPFAKECNNTIILKNPYLIYNGLYIQANKAIIKNNKIAIFEGNVTLFYNDDVIMANKVKVISKENILFIDSFLYDRKLKIWFKNKITKIKKKNIIHFKNGIFSSCCVNNPDWYIHITSGSFNKKTKYLKLHNIVLYIHNIPVFYFPFYFNSLDKTRRSGLLRPYIGYSANEGLLYSQPIYFVLSLRSDLEITPTIRTLRGHGVYSTFRFVDSPYSYGEIKAGIFEDKKSYYVSNNLAHKKHYGYEFYYIRKKLIKNDKLYIHLKYANDVDFYYLNPYNYTFNTSYLTDTLITSKINYIRDFNDSIFGIYARYYIDTTKLSNEDTIQTIPQINYHIYEKKYNNFLTSLDYNIYYHFNEVNMSYYNTTFSIPISLNYHLYHSYFNVKLSEILSGEYAKQINSKYDDSYYLNTYSQLKLYTSLTKFSSYLHVINPSLIYTFKTFSKKSIKNPKIMTYSEINDNLVLKLFQIFMYKNLYIDHSFNQLYNTSTHNMTTMENQVNLKYNDFLIKENNKYDWRIKKVSYNSFEFKFPINKFTFDTTYIYQYLPLTKTLDAKVKRLLNPHKTLYFEYNYDILNKYVKFWMLGIKLDKKCWHYNISFKKDTFPVLQNDGISYKTDNLIYLYVNFYPIGGIKQTFIYKGNR